MVIKKHDLYSSHWAACDALQAGIAERYATPTPRPTDDVETLARPFDEHLKKMGFPWN